MSTIFVFNLIAVLLFLPIGHLLGLSQGGFGLWAGTTVIIPVVAVLGVLPRRGDAGRTVHWHRVVPWFLVWFGAAAVLESVGMVPDAWRTALASLAVGFDYHCAGRNRPQ